MAKKKALTLSASTFKSGAPKLDTGMRPLPIVQPKTPAKVGDKTYTSAALPNDPVYDAEVGNSQRTKDQTLAQLRSGRTDTLSEYGYNASYDPSGNVTDLSFDPNNPFSRAALLKRSYEQGKTGTTNRYAASGQLYAGSLVNAQNQNDYQYQGGQDTLKKNLLRYLSENRQAETGANSQYEGNVGVSDANRVQRAVNSPNQPAPVVASSVVAPEFSSWGKGQGFIDAAKKLIPGWTPPAVTVAPKPFKGKTIKKKGK